MASRRIAVHGRVRLRRLWGSPALRNAFEPAEFDRSGERKPAIVKRTHEAIAAMLLLLGMAALPGRAAAAEPAPFDLTGPGLKVMVERGGETLPVTRVPTLAVGDRIRIDAVLPADQGARYLLVAAFLRGATNPPPEKWFFRAETWERKKNGLDITVPEGARQLLLFLAPRTGGDFDALVDAVRGQPGAFVRATQDLNQASLDRARLDAFVDTIGRQDRTRPEAIEAMSPVLTQSLGIKLKQECLDQSADMQAACLTQSRDSLVLADGHTSSLTETLASTTADLALQVSATPEGGLGYYSPYIGVVRDLARIFGAFQSTHFRYIPALARFEGDRLALLLNAAPSFDKPKSAIVVAMPAIEAAEPPPLRATANKPPLCVAGTGSVLPVEGAPLVYATGYAHAMAARLRRKDGGEIDVPVIEDPARGGYALGPVEGELSGFDEQIGATLHGRWGFLPFDGPRFTLENPAGASWRLASTEAPTTGRESEIALSGGAPACVESVTLRDASGATQPIGWQAGGAEGIRVKLPALKPGAGAMALLVRQRGAADPQEIAIAAPTATRVRLISTSVTRPPAADPLRITLARKGAGEVAVPADARLTFSVDAGTDNRFTGAETVEIATVDGRASARITARDGLTLQSARTAVVNVEPAKMLGGTAYGPLRFRVIQREVAGEWTPLASLIRLPALAGLSCDEATGGCELGGRDLFLIDRVGYDEGFGEAVTIPDGFTGDAVTMPRRPAGKLFLRLRDDPDVVGAVTLP